MKVRLCALLVLAAGSLVLPACEEKSPTTPPANTTPTTPPAPGG
jgi:hypothetical protein